MVGNNDNSNSSHQIMGKKVNLEVDNDNEKGKFVPNSMNDFGEK